MLRRRMVSAAALLLATMLLMPGSVNAAPGGISINSAEVQLETSNVEQVTVFGTGKCEALGTVVFNATVRDLETGGDGFGESSTTCRDVGEAIKWSVAVSAFGVRGGDRALVRVTATLGINDTDEKTLTLQWKT